MKFTLFKGEENDDNVFSLSISNREGVTRRTPSRAYRKLATEADRYYFSEVLLPINSNDLPGQEGYGEFDLKIEERVKRKEVSGNINIVTFFGDQNLDPEKMADFEDIGLLSKFEALFNDHLIGMPYSFSFYKEGNFDDIYNKSTKVYETFSSTIESKNLLGYVPAFVSHNEMEKYIEFYSGKTKGSVEVEGEGKLNAIPLMVDFKRANPDGHKRSVVRLRDLKLAYIKEGFYPIYYAYNVSRPRMSKNANRQIAKEFLLSFLGFDIIGASNAVLQGGGGNSNKKVEFDLENFAYKYQNQSISNYKSTTLRASIYRVQSEYLGNIHQKAIDNNKYVIEELKKRKEASDYLRTMKSPT